MGTQKFEQNSKKVSCGARFGWTVFIASLIVSLVPVGAGAAVDSAVQGEITAPVASKPIAPKGEGEEPVRATVLSGAVSPPTGYTTVAAAYPSDSIAKEGTTDTADTVATKASAGKKNPPFRMPYALVLALVALIGLVPVSRRPRH